MRSFAPSLVPTGRCGVGASLRRTQRRRAAPLPRVPPRVLCGPRNWIESPVKGLGPAMPHCAAAASPVALPLAATSRTIGGASPLSRQWSPGNLDTTRPPRPSFASRRRKVASTDAGDSSSSSSNQSSFTGCPMSPPSSVDGSFSSMKSSPCDEPWMSDSLGERRQVTFTDELAGPQHGASASFRRRRVGGDVSTDGAIVPSGLTGVHVVLQTAAARATKD